MVLMPSAGDGTFDFAKEIAVVDNRFKNAIRMKAYNSAISNTIIDSLGAQQLIPHDYSSAEWSAQTNVLNMLLEPARGYAFSRECATAQNFVRLPKSETIYPPDWQGRKGLTIWIVVEGVDMRFIQCWCECNTLENSLELFIQI